MSVSRPPVAPGTSITSMPIVRNIPRTSATPAIPAAVRWNRSVIGTRSGKTPAPRSTIAFADPTGALVRELHLVIDGREFPSDRDVPGLEVDADAGGLERSAARVDLVRIVSEEREVARVAPRRDAGRDRIDQSIHAVRREPIEVRLRGRLEGRLVPEFGERSIPQAVENDEQDFPRIHFGRRRSGP